MSARSTDKVEAVQEFFSIGDVCALTELKPHVLRYWESQFKFLSPAKNRSGNRVYQRREIEMVLLVKNLLPVAEHFAHKGPPKNRATRSRVGDKVSAIHPKPPLEPGPGGC